ncbi:MAG: hypothetical protein GX451_12680, partial [Acholeplasmataceae bacterium]|nr:hypothetical protein [Acholeplasmataceae bacterium]
MMMDKIYPIIYMMLATVPFSFLQYYPFLANLRTPKIVIASIYGTILFSEIVLFNQNNYVIVPDIVMLFYLLNILLSLVVV